MIHQRTGLLKYGFVGPALVVLIVLNIFPLLYNHGDASRGFEGTFKRRFKTTPDYAASRTYDAVQLLVQNTLMVSEANARLIANLDEGFGR